MENYFLLSEFIIINLNELAYVVGETVNGVFGITITMKDGKIFRVDYTEDDESTAEELLKEIRDNIIL